MADEQLRAPVAAITAGFVELLGVLGQRGLVDKGDLDGVFSLMEHALRRPEDEQALQQMHAWREGITQHSPDTIPLPPDARSDR